MLACCARHDANVLPILGLSAARGFSVSVRGMDDVTPIKERYGGPNDLWSFRTAVVGGGPRPPSGGVPPARREVRRQRHRAPRHAERAARNVG